MILLLIKVVKKNLLPVLFFLFIYSSAFSQGSTSNTRVFATIISKSGFSDLKDINFSYFSVNSDNRTIKLQPTGSNTLSGKLLNEKDLDILTAASLVMTGEGTYTEDTFPVEIISSKVKKIQVRNKHKQSDSFIKKSSDTVRYVSNETYSEKEVLTEPARKPAGKISLFYN